MTNNWIAEVVRFTEASARGVCLHEQDEDCAPFLDADDQCSVCGVSHTGRCNTCGQRGFHRPDCSESDCYQPTAHLACIADALNVGTRVVYPPLPEPSPLPRALVDVMWNARGGK
jgi:hypothetical protein